MVIISFKKRAKLLIAAQKDPRHAPESGAEGKGLNPG